MSRIEGLKVTAPRVERKSRHLTVILLLTGGLFVLESYWLLSAGPRLIADAAEYRVMLGVARPSVSHAFGVVFLAAALGVLVAQLGREAEVRWWRALAAGTWLCASFAIVVMLVGGFWSLGRARVEPVLPLCGTPLLLARQSDYFWHAGLLGWLTVSGAGLFVGRGRRRPGG